MNRNAQIFAGVAAAVAIGVLIWIFALGGGERDSTEPQKVTVETQEATAPEPEAAAEAEPQAATEAEPEAVAEAEPEAVAEAEPEDAAQPESMETAGTQEVTVPDQPEEQAAEEQGEATPERVVPSFDVVRVEPNGDVVIAGRAQPGATVTILDNSKSLGAVEADGRGEWVFLPDDPLTPGTHELALESEKDGVNLLSENVAIIVVPEPQVAATESEAQAETQPEAESSEAPAEAGSGEGGQAFAPEGGVKASVQEPLAVLTSRDGEGGGTQILQSPGEQPTPDALVLEVVDYDAEGNIAVSGRGAIGYSVIVYLDNAPVGQTETGESGRWTVEGAEPVGYGLFTLRADQLDEAGAVVARVETPFSRVEIQLADLPQDQFVVVEPGNSLWVIARRLFGSGFKYSVIFEANTDQIRDPDLIYPGQIFLVPQTPSDG